MNLQKIPYSNHWLFFNHGSQLSQLNDAIPKWRVKNEGILQNLQEAGKGL